MKWIVTLVSLAITSLASAQNGPIQQQQASEQTQIVGGTAASPGEYPWMAAVVADLPGSPLVARQRLFCGATVVGDRWLLTAAHCVVQVSIESFGDLSALVDNPRLIKAVVGVTDLQSANQFAAVRRILVHPSYSVAYTGLDVALLELVEPLAGVPSLSLVTPADDASLLPGGAAVTAIGWGRTNVTEEEGPDQAMLPNLLQEAQLSVVDTASCAAAWATNAPIPAQAPVLIDVNVLCASAANRAVCSGDSGGPLLVRDASNNWRQAGVVSFGPSGCTSERPDGFARASAAAGWVKQCSDSMGQCAHKFVQCWDLNLNGGCDAATEDKDADGLCSVADCRDASSSATASPSSTVRLVAEPKGKNCAAGGQRLDTGADGNGNGTLDDDEVTASSYVCNGKDDGGCRVGGGAGGTPLSALFCFAVAWCLSRRRTRVARRCLPQRP